jgi:hypothetical protein
MAGGAMEKGRPCDLPLAAAEARAAGMSDPFISNPYAPPKAELHELPPVPGGLVRVGRLLVVKRGCEYKVPSHTCVCCGGPAVAVKRRTYERYPDWSRMLVIVGALVVLPVCLLLRVSAMWVVGAFLAGCLVAGKAKAGVARVTFGECRLHRRLRFGLTAAGIICIAPGLVILTGLLKPLREVPSQDAAYAIGALLLGLLCERTAAGLLPRARHIDDRKIIFANCGRRWLEQFPAR